MQTSWSEACDQVQNWQKRPYPANPPPACLVFMPTILAAVAYAVITL
jgi:hypothetical protein